MYNAVPHDHKVGIVPTLRSSGKGTNTLLVLVRHGESLWNLENRFTGWVDIGLSVKGREEAHFAGRQLKGFRFDEAFTSALSRAQETLEIILKETLLTGIPTFKDQALNERHYGDLQGLNKAETAKKYGEEQVHTWRRSYDVQPPNGESLKDTAARALPYFRSKIMAEVQKGKNILVVAHGNSLRAAIMFLEDLSPEKIISVEIATGQPWIYEIGADGKVLSKKISPKPV